MTKSKKILTLLLCFLLTAAVLFVTGCGKKSGDGTGSDAEVQVVGEGEKTFELTVTTDNNENDAKFEVHTDKSTVGDALLELGIIEGEEGQYGLYVKTVNGITADADKDQAYWAFYVNDEYSSYGVDMTNIVEGDSYAFKYETL